MKVLSSSLIFAFCTTCAINPVNAMDTKSAVQAARDKATVLPDEYRQSYPIPVRHGKGAGLVFLYCNAVLKPGVGQYLYAPSHRITLDEKGRFEKLEAVVSSDLGVVHDDKKALGVHAAPKDLSVQEVVKKQEQLFQLYDRLIPAYLTGGAADAAGLKDDAKEFRRLFELLVEAPLLPYYKVTGADFFGWLDRVATGGR